MLFDRLGQGWAEFKDRLANLRALVVDDEEVIRDIVSEILRSEGFEVEACPDAASGWERLNAKPFDLLVTDKNLPDRSGLYLLFQVKQAGLDVPSAVITGYASIHSISEAFSYGAADYIAKPFDDVGHVARRLKSIAERRIAERLYRRIIADLKTAMTSSGADHSELDGLARELGTVKDNLLQRPALLVIDPKTERAAKRVASLRERGLSVQVASSAAAAADGLKSSTAPLVALISLDVPNPATFVFETRAAEPLTEIVVTRDDASLEAGLAAIDAGASDFVDSSIEDDDILVARVRRLVELARSQRLHVHLIAALVRRVRADSATANAVLAVLPPEQRRYLDALATPATPAAAPSTLQIDLAEVLGVRSTSPVAASSISPSVSVVVGPSAPAPAGQTPAAVLPPRPRSGPARVVAVAAEVGAELPTARPAEPAARLATLGQNAAELVHEIRQPLLGIKAHAQHLARSGEVTVPVLERVNAMLAYAGRIEAILERVAAVVRGEVNRPAATRCQVNRLVEAACQLSKLNTAPNVHIDTALEPELPEAVADPIGVQQILTNLLTNASAALRQAGGLVVIRTRRVGRAVEVMVEDDGPGIPNEVRERLFEPYFTTKAEGTGLGLSVSRRIAETSGGSLELVDSERGAHFRLRLPAAGA